MTEEQLHKAGALFTEKRDLEYDIEKLRKQVEDKNFMEVLRYAAQGGGLGFYVTDILDDFKPVFEKLANEIVQRIENRIAELDKQFAEV